MKKTILGVVIVVGMFFGCGEDGLNPSSGTNGDLLTPQAVKMMTDGDQMLQDAVNTYTNLPDSIRGRVIQVADYAMFPLYYSESKGFARRMRDVFTGDDNFINAHSLIMCRLTNGDSVSPSPARRVLARGITMEDVQTGADIACVLFPEAAPFIEIGLGVLDMFGFGGPSVEDQILDQVKKINQTLNQVQQEMRQGFNMVNQQLDDVIGRLSDLKGDINLVTSGIDILIQNDFVTVKGRFDGFLNNYASALNQTEASNAAYNYMNESSNFDGDLVNVLDLAINLQGWCLSEGKYIYDTIESDPASSTNLLDIMVEPISHASNVHLTYPNTKKMLIMSLGGFEYAAKMIKARLNMNRILYPDPATCAQKNKLLAQVYINLLASKGVWDNGQSVINQIAEKYKYYKNTLETQFFMNWFAGLSGSDYIYMYKNGEWISSFHSGSYNTAAANAALLQQYELVQQEYMVIWLVKLAQLKVELQSYL